MKHVLCALVLIVLAGCCQDKAATNRGGKRTITLYANDGQVIQTWQPDDNCDSFEQGWALFRVNGKKVKVTGTMVSEEK